MIKLTRSRMPYWTQLRRESIELLTLVALRQQPSLQRQFAIIFEEWLRGRVCIIFSPFLFPTDKRPTFQHLIVATGSTQQICCFVIFLSEPRRRPCLVCLFDFWGGGKDKMDHLRRWHWNEDHRMIVSHPVALANIYIQAWDLAGHVRTKGKKKKKVLEIKGMNLVSFLPSLLVCYI